MNVRMILGFGIFWVFTACADSSVPKEVRPEESDLPVWKRSSFNSLTDLKELQNRLSQVLPSSQEATVAILSFNGSGSGVIVSPDGLVLTAGHIAEDPNRKVMLVLKDGTEVQGVTLGISWAEDAGMIQIVDSSKREIWPYVSIAPPNQTQVGDWCFGLGHPDGYQEDRGMVLRIGRVLDKRGRYVLQSDARLLGGDSGGPLFDFMGRVIAIHSRISIVPEENFHTPIEAFHQHWKQLLAKEVIQVLPRRERGFLGVTTEEDSKGVRVARVVENSAAAEANVQVGDIITSVNDYAVADPAEFVMVLGLSKPDEKVTLHLLRDLQSITLEITLRTWPKRILELDDDEEEESLRPYEP